MENKLKILLLIVFSTLSTVSFGQYSIGGGISTLHGAGIDITRYGINAYYEAPRTEVNTFYIRPTLMLPQKFVSNNGSIETTDEAFNQGVSPSVIGDLRTVEKTSYFSLDGGTRIYFINTYDAGFSLYGGGHLKGIISSYSQEIDISGLSIDPNNYKIPGDKTYALLFSFGGNFGAKYQLPYRGAIVFDLALDLISRLYDPAVILGNEISPLSLSFNLAYRFDWY
jgi:hypothetical protein